jgi:hypothetical protein
MFLHLRRCVQYLGFYSVSAQELALTTIVGLVAVTGVAFISMPHWTSSLFFLPLI